MTGHNTLLDYHVLNHNIDHNNCFYPTQVPTSLTNSLPTRLGYHEQKADIFVYSRYIYFKNKQIIRYIYDKIQNLEAEKSLMT